MSDYKYDATTLDFVIAVANRYKEKAKISEDFIRGLETARNVLRTEEDDKKILEDFLNGKPPNVKDEDWIPLSEIDKN